MNSETLYINYYLLDRHILAWEPQEQWNGIEGVGRSVPHGERTRRVHPCRNDVGIVALDDIP